MFSGNNRKPRGACSVRFKKRHKAWDFAVIRWHKAFGERWAAASQALLDFLCMLHVVPLQTDLCGRENPGLVDCRDGPEDTQQRIFGVFFTVCNPISHPLIYLTWLPHHSSWAGFWVYSWGLGFLHGATSLHAAHSFADCSSHLVALHKLVFGCKITELSKLGATPLHSCCWPYSQIMQISKKTLSFPILVQALQPAFSAASFFLAVLLLTACKGRSGRVLAGPMQAAAGFTPNFPIFMA